MKEQLPIYQIQDFHAQTQKERYFYASSFAAHLREHRFIREPHKHNFYIILFITRGSGSHTIDFRKYDVQPHMAFFLIPGQVHSWELSDDADGFIFFFTPEFYLQEFPHRKLYDFPFFNTMLHQPRLFLAPGDNAMLLPTARTLLAEYETQAWMRLEMLSCCLGVLLIQLTRIYKSQGTELKTQGSALSLLQKLESLIDQHYKEHLPVSFYADQLHVTARHLKEVCKQALGKTTHALLQERSILEAQRLLVHADLTSSQIAATLGYFDVPYFFRFFKKHTGYTPEQFRSLNK